MALSVQFFRLFLRRFGVQCQVASVSQRTTVELVVNKMPSSLCTLDSRSHPFTVAIEGNIGSGKTTLLKYFEQFSDVEVLQEPVEQWRNVKGHNLLNLMYQDSTRWSLTFQTYVQLTMVKAHMQKQIASVKMMERSIYSAKYCFVENLFRESKMPEAEFVVLTEWFDWLIKNLDMQLNLIVYLRTSPEVVYERVKKRCRAEEQCVPLQYLKHLHDLHENWLISQQTFPVPAPVLILDGNLSQAELYKQYEENKSKILNHTEGVFNDVELGHSDSVHLKTF